MMSSESTLAPLLRKLGRGTPLCEAETAAVLALPHTIRRFEARHDIALVGERMNQCCLVLEGWAHRYACLRNGTRQILSFYIPGDVPDLQHLYLPVMDHNLASLTPCTLAFIPHAAIRSLVETSPVLMAACWRDTLVDASIYREHIASLGRRQSVSRTAHLFCEMYQRQKLAGLAGKLSCPLPATQGELADALGITHAHLNRSLRTMRTEHGITLQGGVLTIRNWANLVEVADFDPTYLHFADGEA